MEKLVDWWSAGETEVLGENLPQYHFVHHKPHMLYNIACGSVWVWNLVPDIKGGT
jgi:hypothetical protein